MLTDVFDCHVHTTRSACGEDITDQWLAQRAAENRVTFAVTDHTMHLYYEPEIAWAISRPDGIALFEARRDSGRERVREYLADIRACGQPNMLVGVELDVLPDGQIMFPDDLRADLDILIAALHFMPTHQRNAPERDIIAEFRQQTRWLLEYGVDVLAHPFRILLQFGIRVDEKLFNWTIDLAGEHGAAVEINSHKVFPEYDVRMVQRALANGMKIAIGSDAHNTREFGVFTYHEQILRQAGIDEERWQEILFRVGNH